jgi:hypothetical protein
MAGVEEAYRLSAIQQTARADRAEAASSALRAQRFSIDAELGGARAEAQRLRAVVEAQAAQIAALRAQLRDAQSAAQQLAVETFAASVLSSIERGSSALRGYVLAAAAAEIRGALHIGTGPSAISIGSARTLAPEALSTFSFTLAPLAPTLAEEPVLRGLDRLVGAVLDLQRALDRELPAPASGPAQVAIAQAAAVASAPTITADSAGARLGDLVAALRALAGALPAIKTAVGAVADASAVLEAGASADALRSAAAALGDLSGTLDALGP